MSRRVLVTGGTGFIGRHALAALTERGYDVHAVTSRGGSAAGATWHQADLLDPRQREALIAEVDASDLLHLAWYAEHGAFWESPENRRWLDASKDLVRAFTAAGGTRAVLAGTCAEYRWDRETHCVEGVTALEPATAYGQAKNALRAWAEDHAAESGLSLAWGRIFFLFGPAEDPRRLVASVAKALVSGQIAETSHGEQLRDFAYSPEIADAFAALLQSDVTGAVNVVSGRPVRIRDVVEAVGRAAGRPDLLRIGARLANPNEPDVLTAASDRLNSEVGWQPSRTLEQSIEQTVQWWRDAGAQS